MHDHYTVTSTESDRQYVRTVIAANRRDAKHTHREHYPHATVTAGIGPRAGHPTRDYLDASRTRENERIEAEMQRQQAALLESRKSVANWPR